MAGNSARSSMIFPLTQTHTEDKEARYNGATALYVASLKGYVPWLQKYHGHPVEPTASQPLPSGYVKIAIENGHRNSGFSH